MATAGEQPTAQGATTNTSSLASGYGTAGERVLHDLRRQLDSFSANSNGNPRASSEEQSALLPRVHDALGAPPPGRIARYMRAHLSRDRADLVLLFSYLITGLLDSSATAIWGSFVSMQTGNSIYLGLGLADPTGSGRWIKSLVSIAGFCAGAFCFARFHARAAKGDADSGRRRWVLVTSVLLQFLCIAVAAIIVTVTPDAEGGRERGGMDLHWHDVVPLAIVSFQSSGQAVISRALKYNSLTSVVLTSIYCDLWSDANIFALHNVERNRRAAAPILLLLGALVGGFWARTEIGMAGALWTAAGLKACMVLMWLLWKAEPDN
ncbi:hypothetical protein F5Y15DRAFT_132144 [Xylariaceae sp. FL0016]|nr:hypothetical protein F5Y15DRAFT_132144 [Xylariaceae sp. FL0016]